MRVIYSMLVILFAISSGLSGQEWLVPPERAKVLSPFQFTDETRKTGEELFMKNCKQCHGEPGKNKAAALVPHPPDPAAEQIQHNSDGSLLFKIQEGRSLMPPFKNTLSTTEIWNIISYVRSFNKGYKQQASQKGEKGAETIGKASVRYNWNKDRNQIEAIFRSEKDSIVKPLAGAEVELYVERYFGNLLIGKARKTDQDGKAMFDFPKDIPGDSLGQLFAFAKFTDEMTYGEVKNDTLLYAGIPTLKPALNEKRAMWNIVQKTPWWLLISYIVIVLSIWAVIFYVIARIRAIYLLGKEENGEDSAEPVNMNREQT